MSATTETTVVGTTSSFLVLLIAILLSLTGPSTSSIESFVYGGCSQYRFAPGSPYENSVNSILTSLTSSASLSTYNNFTSGSQDSVVYALFQCRGDLTNTDCAHCVYRAVTRLGTLCVDASGGAVQLEGCFVKYDNTTFLGVEDKSLLFKKCGPLVTYESDTLARRDALLGYIGTNDGTKKPYRAGASEDMEAVAQCVEDLDGGECQDCMTEAITRLKTECGAAKWGDLFLGKCYVRYSKSGDHSSTGGYDTGSNDEQVEKTLAIIIGMIAGVAVIIVFLSLMAKLCESGKGGK